jgi:hypothetical protein
MMLLEVSFFVAGVMEGPHYFCLRETGVQRSIVFSPFDFVLSLLLVARRIYSN